MIFSIPNYFEREINIITSVICARFLFPYWHFLLVVRQWASATVSCFFLLLQLYSCACVWFGIDDDLAGFFMFQFNLVNIWWYCFFFSSVVTRTQKPWIYLFSFMKNIWHFCYGLMPSLRLNGWNLCAYNVIFFLSRCWIWLYSGILISTGG